MATVVAAIVAGTTYTLTDENPFWIEHISEWGMAPGHMLESRGAEQHGTTVEDFRLDPRDLELIIGFRGLNSELLTARRTLLSIFQRRTDPVLIRFTFDDGTVRQIDGTLASGLGFARDGQDHDYQRAAAVIHCGDPTFYDPAGQGVTFELGGAAGAGGIVPTPVPTEVGASTLDASAPITYAGTWRSLPTLIRITGPITDFVLTNVTTGADITAKSGVSISSGNYVDICCLYGQVSVLFNGVTNWISNITDGSELTTWALEPDPDAPGGINTITLTGSGVTDQTSVHIAYYERFLGA
jgi:hypothetical protein